jgi:hypothetical protein
MLAGSPDRPSQPNALRHDNERSSGRRKDQRWVAVAEKIVGYVLAWIRAKVAHLWLGSIKPALFT